MIQILLASILALLLVCIALQVAVLRRRPALDLSPLQGRLDALDRAQERTERAVREEIATGREESGIHARGLREDVGASMKGMGELVLQNLGRRWKTDSDISSCETSLKLSWYGRSPVCHARGGGGSAIRI